jgi:hypothetical protein
MGKQVKLYEISRGEQVMSFIEYLHHPMLGIHADLIPLYEQLGSLLFKDGWTWVGSPARGSSCAFSKDQYVINYPTTAWMKKYKHTVRISYYTAAALLDPVGLRFDVADVATELQLYLDRVAALELQLYRDRVKKKALA